MIYAKLTNGQTLIVLEPKNLDYLRVGKEATTPDGSIIIAFTPDMRFTTGELEKATAEGRMDGERFGKIMLESMKRPEVREQQEYGYKQVLP